MADHKLPTRHGEHVPSVLSDIGRPSDLTRGNHWFGFERGVLERNTAVVNADTAYLKARELQHDQYTRLMDAKMRIMRKIAELHDLPNVIADEQQQREHARGLAGQRRALESRVATHERRLAAVRQDAELTRAREQGVRARRNLDAAERVKDAEVDRWYAEAQARANNASAEYQDTLADLQRGQAASDGSVGAAANQRAADLTALDHEIELGRERGNEAAVLALLNLRARLQGAS